MGAADGSINTMLINPLLNMIPNSNIIPKSLAQAGLGLLASKFKPVKKYALKYAEYKIFDAGQNLSTGLISPINNGGW